MYLCIIIMAAFIDNDNQKLLWNTLHNVPLFIHNVSENYRATWFKEIIGEFYEKNRYRALSKQELDLLNREVMRYMMQILKQSFAYNTKESSQEITYSFNKAMSQPIEKEDLNVIELPSYEKNVSWEDQNNNKILDKLNSLETEIALLKNEVKYMKNKLYGEEINDTVDYIVNSSIAKN